MENVVSDELIKRLLSKLNPRNTFKFTKDFQLYGLDNEYLQIYTMLENTFKYREGKSCIIIGPRGVAKTTLVNKCLWELERNQYEFFTIRLNGSFHTDDKTAIKEIAKQLDFYLQHYNQDKKRLKLQATFEQTSVTATMNVIINILDKTKLSESDENVETAVDENGFVIKQRRQLMPIVFVIEDIDVYAQHSKQTLLYNLFDIAQSSSSKTGGEAQDNKGTAINVIGITTRATVREQLEKRVKSRFSQRLILINKSKNLEGFSECVYHMFKLNDNNGSDENVVQYNNLLRQSIFDNNISEIRKAIIRNYYTIKDLNGLKNEVLPNIMNLVNKETEERIVYDSVGDYKNKHLDLLQSLSEIELKVLVCCCRVKMKSTISAVNFDLMNEEYQDMVTSERREIQTKLETMGVSLKENHYGRSKTTLRAAWERLLSLGLLHRVANKAQLTLLVESGLEMDEIVAGAARDKWLMKWSKL